MQIAVDGTSFKKLCFTAAYRCLRLLLASTSTVIAAAKRVPRLRGRQLDQCGAEKTSACMQRPLGGRVQGLARGFSLLRIVLPRWLLQGMFQQQGRQKGQTTNTAAVVVGSRLLFRKIRGAVAARPLALLTEPAGVD